MTSSAKRIDEYDAKDIEYDEFMEFDLKEQDNLSDVE